MSAASTPLVSRAPRRSDPVRLANLGRDEEAIRCYDRGLEIDPRDATAWLNRAVSAEALGRWAEAAESYRKFLALVAPQYEEQVGDARRRLRELEE